MSNVHTFIAQVFGSNDAMRMVESLARAVEADADVKAETFDVLEQETDVPDRGAVVFRSTLSAGHWSAIEPFFSSKAITRLDACVYLVWLREGFAIHSECRHRGSLLASDGETLTELEDAAYRAFVSHVWKFGTHPDWWLKDPDPTLGRHARDL